LECPNLVDLNLQKTFINATMWWPVELTCCITVGSFSVVMTLLKRMHEPIKDRTFVLNLM
jgi:hypothetical protein